MRILYLTSVDVSDDMAPSVHVRGTCQELHRLGHEVALIHKLPTRGCGIRGVDLDLVRGVPWPNVRGGWKLFQLAAAIQVIRLARLWKPNVIYVRCPLTRVIAEALRHTHLPVVLELNGMLPSRGSTNNLLGVCHRILVDDPVLAESISFAFPEQKYKVRTHLTFVTDPKHFAPIDRELACSTLGMDPKIVRITHVSSFHEWHDFTTIIEAARLLSKRASLPIELRLLGDGPLWEKLKSHIAVNKLENLIKIPGRVDFNDLPLHLAASNIAVDLLTEDKLRSGKNLGAYKLYEYMASGVPAITAVSSDFKTPNWAHECLTVIPAQSPTSLVSAIDQILSNPAIAQRKSVAARQYVCRCHTWEAATKTTLKHLDELLAEWSN